MNQIQQDAKKLKHLPPGESFLGLSNRGEYRNMGSSEYSNRMSQPDTRALKDPYTEFYLKYMFDFEVGSEIPDAPRSVYEPDQLWEQLTRYSSDRKPKVEWDDHLQDGVSMAYKVFAKPDYAPHEEPLSSEESVKEDGLRLDKSSGLPAMTSKREDFDRAYSKEVAIREDHASPAPCVAFARTQSENKTRLVWGYPAEMTILESRFARPLIDRFLSYNTTMAFGLTDMELGTQLHHQLQDYNDGEIYAIDYSKFDSTISAELIAVAFDILSTWFEDESLKKWGWDTIVSYFITTPIVMPDGNLYTGKRHGVPSGSFFTQVIDSIVNTILIGSVWSRFNQPVHHAKLFVLGDDSIFPMYSDIPMEKIEKHLSNYGIVVNSEKSEVGELSFLSADWTSGLADREMSEVLERVVFPETWRSYDEDSFTWQRAEQVLRSMATQYATASKLLNVGDNRMNQFDTTAFRINQRIGRDSPSRGEPDSYSTGYGTYKAETFEQFYGKERSEFRTLAGLRLV